MHPRLENVEIPEPRQAHPAGDLANPLLAGDLAHQLHVGGGRTVGKDANDLAVKHRDR